MLRVKTRELSGAFGDIGTFIPLFVGYVTVNGLHAGSILTTFGLTYILTGAIYGVPIAVQPMKAIAALAITEGATPGEIQGTAILIGLLFLIMGATGLIRVLEKRIPIAVVRGIQLGLGLKFVILSLQYVAGDGSLGLALALLGLLVVLVLLRRSILPASLALLGLGIIAALALQPGSISPEPLVLQLTLPSIAVPSASEALQGLLFLGIPQIPQTIGNAVIAAALLSRQYYGEKGATTKKLSTTIGLVNSTLPWFGAIPICHGAGGIAAHHRFGARTGKSLFIIGAILMASGLFLGGMGTQILRMIPLPIIGVFLLFVGGELILPLRQQRTRYSRIDWAVILTIGGIAVAHRYGMVIALIIGLALHYATRTTSQRAGQKQ